VKLGADGKPVIFGLTIPFGPISNLKNPGSIDIKPSTLALLTKEVCLNLYRDGVKTILLAMGHDLSLGALMVTARELAAETDDGLTVIVANWLPAVVKLLPEVFEDMPAGKRDGHGGAGETARMLAQHPKLVDRSQMRDYNVDAYRSPVPFTHPIAAGGGVYAPKKTSNHDPAFPGILGFPSIATAEVGERLYDALSEWIADVAREYCFGSAKSYNY
jgi:creatinine amidohydrolase